MPSPPLFLSSRAAYRCCRYPTLPGRNGYEICELCNWEDDGQDDGTADAVWGASNSDYSLSEARQNFKRYRVMYEPRRDQRITGKDSPLEYDTKGLLMQAFDRLQNGTENERSACEGDVAKLEIVLQNETARQVQEYEQRNSQA